MLGGPHCGAPHLREEETASGAHAMPAPAAKQRRGSPPPAGRGRLLASQGLWDQFLSTAQSSRPRSDQHPVLLGPQGRRGPRPHRHSRRRASGATENAWEVRPQADRGHGSCAGTQTGGSKSPANQQSEKNRCIRFTIHKIYKKGWGGPGRPAPGPPDLDRASSSACLTGRDQDPPVCWGPSGRLGLDV